MIVMIFCFLSLLRVQVQVLPGSAFGVGDFGAFIAARGFLPLSSFVLYFISKVVDTYLLNCLILKIILQT